MSDLSFRDAYEGGYDHGPLKRVEIREGFGKHQIAILDYLIPASNVTALAPGATPMAFRWSMSPVDVRTFYGYVNHHEYVDTNVTASMRLRFYCVGTSLPMNDPNPASWNDVTASYIARQVAERHGLRAIVHNSKSILPYWTPGAGSDFDMMNRLADSTGYRFWVDGATLYFIDPEVLLTSPQRSVASTYRMDREVSDTLQEVWSITGSLAPVDSAPVVQHIFGIDSNDTLIRSSSTQRLAQSRLDVPLQQRVLPKNVGSLAEADRMNEIAATSGSWSSIQAITRGDARARVGALVSLDGNGLNQHYQGVWLATDLIHVIDSNSSGIMQYTTQINLTRNQLGSLYFKTTATLKDALSEVPAVLRGEVWEASVLEAVYV